MWWRRVILRSNHHTLDFGRRRPLPVSSWPLSAFRRPCDRVRDWRVLASIVKKGAARLLRPRTRREKTSSQRLVFTPTNNPLVSLLWTLITLII